LGTGSGLREWLIQIALGYGAVAALACIIALAIAARA
jgi:hypothetical protein